MTVFVAFRLPLTLVRPPTVQDLVAFADGGAALPYDPRRNGQARLTNTAFVIRVRVPAWDLNREGSGLHGPGQNLPPAPVRRAGPAISWDPVAQVFS
jgi:hypothetical protein